jgi:hypothetical protein
MAADVLQAFLTQRMFDVGGDDSRVAALREAAADVAGVVKAAPERTACFTMVAIDSQVSKDEPLVGEVMKVLEKRWQSYAGAFTDALLPTVARAIILHGLGAAMASEAIAASVSLTGRNMLPHIGDVRDRELWSGILADADRRLALRAQREWSLPSATQSQNAELNLESAKPLGTPALAKDWLTKKLEASAGPSNSAGETLADANQYWPNQGQAWSLEFAPRAASGIAGAVNGVVKTLVEEINKRAASEVVVPAINEFVGNISKAFLQTAIGLERRMALMWWKEALYSPLASTSYRELDPSLAAALAALDASAQTGAFAPRTAEAVISEALRSIGPEMAAGRTLADHSRAVLASASHRAAIQSGYSAIHDEPGRVPLGGLLAGQEDLTPEIIGTRLGLDPALEVSAIELGLWLFRDLQAAAATPARVKRKRVGKQG